jgi:hypothetical protein
VPVATTTASERPVGCRKRRTGAAWQRTRRCTASSIQQGVASGLRERWRSSARHEQ